ncbi:MAG: UDP-N-acetylglucosamine 2-epimerase (non-hydrolyzing) [Candidatus Woesearchaeota archaeon]|nr:UDP-N-acetylglucosamine 2-epimerase (non-hydrolyzing) [Candidatus Woesearchaeota archaeon]
MKICILVGTRPEIIKMAPVIRECERRKLDFFIVHSGQHYSYNMDKIFFEELKLPEPKYNLEVGSGAHYAQTALILERIGEVFSKEKPDVLIVQGDTNTVFAGAITASKMGIRVAHVEAGLRSYDRSMPEEINRILTDHCSDLLFAPTKLQRKILIKEGIPKERIFVTGNTIVDSVRENIKFSDGKILEKFGLKKGNYFLITAHRQENVEDKTRLEGILNGIKMLYDKFGLQIIYPLHPRTKKKIEEFNLSIPKEIIIAEPLGFLEFLRLESDSALILTDSGGLQEEACILKVPCVTLRDNTERPETIEAGANMLSGINPEKIVECAGKMLAARRDWKNPLGKGKSARKIIDAILDCK